jgi:hypothetical protein
MISAPDTEQQKWARWECLADDDLPSYPSPMDSAQCRRAWQQDLHRLNLENPRGGLIVPTPEARYGSN